MTLRIKGTVTKEQGARHLPCALLLILPKIMPPAGGKSQIFVKRKNGFNFLEVRFVIERFILQDFPDLQKRPTSGIGYQTAVKFLLVVQEITPCI